LNRRLRISGTGRSAVLAREAPRDEWKATSPPGDPKLT
jgi:hypothetical protein